MAKKSYPGKRAALENYKKKYLDQLQQHTTYKVFRDYRDEILADPELGITPKALERAEYQVLEKRRRDVVKSQHAHAQ